ncbi:hypothetical protein CCP2SC5_2360002 [Azospirillaceae bacterium]
MTPIFTRKNGKMYRYYVSQTAIRKGYEACPLRTVSAGVIEGAVVAQLRALLRTPEIIVRTWKQTAAENGERIDENEISSTLRNLDPLWDALFPAEQARLVRPSRLSRHGEHGRRAHRPPRRRLGHVGGGPSPHSRPGGSP